MLFLNPCLSHRQPLWQPFSLVGCRITITAVLISCTHPSPTATAAAIFAACAHTLSATFASLLYDHRQIADRTDLLQLAFQLH